MTQGNAQTLYKKLDLVGVEYYKTHLELVNCLIRNNDKKLTPREIELLAEFMSLEGILSELRFGPTAKKVVRERLEMSQAAMSNHISNLLEKLWLIKTGDIMSIHRVLIPFNDEQSYQFKIKRVINASTGTE